MAVTRGVKVSVKCGYVADQSAPDFARFVFYYTVRITNEGQATVQLVSRHWVISDASDHVEEVRGPGVVGVQPVLQPGQAFEYTSGCVLKTPHGTMSGTYQMVRPDGSQFDAEIAPFTLLAPFVPPPSSTPRLLN